MEKQSEHRWIPQCGHTSVSGQVPGTTERTHGARRTTGRFTEIYRSGGAGARERTAHAAGGMGPWRRRRSVCLGQLEADIERWRGRNRAAACVVGSWDGRGWNGDGMEWGGLEWDGLGKKYHHHGQSSSCVLNSSVPGYPQPLRCVLCALDNPPVQWREQRSTGKSAQGEVVPRRLSGGIWREMPCATWSACPAGHWGGATRDPRGPGDTERSARDQGAARARLEVLSREIPVVCPVTYAGSDRLTVVGIGGRPQGVGGGELNIQLPPGQQPRAKIQCRKVH